MAKFIFRYGTMGSSKSANALMVKYNYEEKGKKVVLLKPSIETRDGIMQVRSRIGLASDCILAENFLSDEANDNTLEERLQGVDVIIIDEVQFLDPKYVDMLRPIVDDYGIPVLCYGLKTDFMSHLFEASKRLMELVDEITEIPTICWCGRKARFNARIDGNGHVMREGEQVALGGNESYTALCRIHYFSGQTHATDDTELT